MLVKNSQPHSELQAQFCTPSFRFFWSVEEEEEEKKNYLTTQLQKCLLSIGFCSQQWLPAKVIFCLLPGLAIRMLTCCITSTLRLFVYQMSGAGCTVAVRPSNLLPAHFLVKSNSITMPARNTDPLLFNLWLWIKHRSYQFLQFTSADFWLWPYSTSTWRNCGLVLLGC